MFFVLLFSQTFSLGDQRTYYYSLSDSLTVSNYKEIQTKVVTKYYTKNPNPQKEEIITALPHLNTLEGEPLFYSPGIVIGITALFTLLAGIIYTIFFRNIHAVPNPNYKKSQKIPMPNFNVSNLEQQTDDFSQNEMNSLSSESEEVQIQQEKPPKIIGIDEEEEEKSEQNDFYDTDSLNFLRNRKQNRLNNSIPELPQEPALPPNKSRYKRSILIHEA